METEKDSNGISLTTRAANDGGDTNVAPAAERTKDAAVADDATGTSAASREVILPPLNGQSLSAATTILKQTLAEKQRQMQTIQESEATSNVNKNNNAENNIANNYNNKPTGKKRKRASGIKYKRRPPPDIRLTPALEERLQPVKREKEVEEKANKALAEAERQLAEAQKKLTDAKEWKQAAFERAEAASVQFAGEVAAAPGPWKEHYDHLVAYHAEHGTCIVRGQSAPMKALRNWTLKQRERYHLGDANPNKLPWYYARNLDKLSFLWNVTDDTWQKHFQDLVEFKQKFGHTAVPRGYKPNPTLAHWVKRMRHEGNKFKEDRDSKVSMTEAQLQKLEDLGFLWENLNRSWNERFEELVKFTEQHGHCAITKDSNVNPKLVQFCQNARAHHRAFTLGKKTTMTMQRKVKLEELGFPWELLRSPSDATKEGPAKREKLTVPNDESDDNMEEAEPIPAQEYNGHAQGDGHPTPGYQTHPYYQQQQQLHQYQYHSGY